MNRDTERPVHHTKTEPMHPLNELLAVVYPDLAPYPCAGCAKAAGDSLRIDAHGAQALVCRECNKLPASELDFTLLPNEREIVRVHVQRVAQVAVGR